MGIKDTWTRRRGSIRGWALGIGLAFCMFSVGAVGSVALGITAPVQARPAAAVKTADQQAANRQVCRDLVKQGTWFKQHQATITLQDVITMGTWFQQDAAAATGQLHADLALVSAGYQHALSSLGDLPDSATEAATRANVDCALLGVQIKAS